MDDPILFYYVDLVFDHFLINEMLIILLLCLIQLVARGHCVCLTFHLCLLLLARMYLIFPTIINFKNVFNDLMNHIWNEAIT